MQRFVNARLASLLLFAPALGLATPPNHAVCGIGTVNSFSENYQGTGKFTATIKYSTLPNTGQSPPYIIINTSNPSANDLMSRANILSAYLSRGFVRLSSNVPNNQNCQLIDSVAACRTQAACSGLRNDR